MATAEQLTLNFRNIGQIRKHMDEYDITDVSIYLFLSDLKPQEAGVEIMLSH